MVMGTVIGEGGATLSGGEKQKIACGSAAAIDPDIYVLDEPSSNLDAYAIADFRQLLFTFEIAGKDHHHL